jgi:Ca2+-binding RTX toxin-like protein
VTINLGTQTFSGGEAAGDTIVGIENAYGSNYNDTIYGTSGVNTLAGYAGNDTLYGNEGNDTLTGGDGDDKLYGNDSNDILTGDVGDDALIGGDGNDTLNGGEGGDRFDGEAGDDKIYGNNGDDYLYASLGSDLLDGGAGIDTISYYYSDVGVEIKLSETGTTSISKYGYATGDIISSIENLRGSNTGNDLLVGNSVNNTLWGYAENDTLIGGTGIDTFYGGAGNDVFRYLTQSESVNTGKDVITDFETGKDKFSIGFTTTIANVLIQSSAGFNVVSIANTDFAVQVNNNITLSDIVIAA